MKKYESKALDKYIAGMVEKIEENTTKCGWKQNKDDWFLENKLLEEIAEYFKSIGWSDLRIIQSFISELQDVDIEKSTKKEQKRELADIGNISMMLYDNI